MTSDLPADWQPQYIAESNVPLKRALCHEGTLIQGRDSQETRKKVHQFLRAIDFLPHNFEAYFQTAVCRAQPTGSRLCRFYDENTPQRLTVERAFGISDVKHFLRTNSKWFITGFDTVPKEEAQRRADICQRCPMNVEVTGCAGCQDFAGDVARVLKGNSAVGLSTLRGCGVCACSLPALVWLPIRVLEPIDPAHPSWCWKREE